MKSPITYNRQTETLPVSFLIIAYLLGLYFYSRFPQIVASHWNFEGTVDGYTTKAIGAFGMPVLLSVMYVLFLVIPTLDPRKDRYMEFADIYHKFRTFILGMMLAIYIILGLFNLGYPVNVSAVVPSFIGVLMVLIGNYMGKIKPNWFLGIRTPWTLSSDVVWNKTHRVGGYLFVFFGLLLLVAASLGNIFSMYLVVGGAAGLTGFVFIYSYLLYQKEKK